MENFRIASIIINNLAKTTIKYQYGELRAGLVYREMKRADESHTEPTGTTFNHGRDGNGMSVIRYICECGLDECACCKEACRYSISVRLPEPVKWAKIILGVVIFRHPLMMRVNRFRKASRLHLSGRMDVCSSFLKITHSGCAQPATVFERAVQKLFMILIGDEIEALSIFRHQHHQPAHWSNIFSKSGLYERRNL